MDQKIFKACFDESIYGGLNLCPVVTMVTQHWSVDGKQVMGYITVVLLAIIQNGAFQNDLIDFFRTPFMWYVQLCDWLVYPTYDNGFNQKISYTGGEARGIRILAIVAVLFILVVATNEK